VLPSVLKLVPNMAPNGQKPKQIIKDREKVACLVEQNPISV
jgi:hypothetical protein